VFGVWCAVSATRIIELNYFSGAVNSEIAVNKVLYHILKMRKNSGFFQQGNVTACTANNSVDVLHNIFGISIICPFGLLIHLIRCHVMIISV